MPPPVVTDPPSSRNPSEAPMDPAARLSKPRLVKLRKPRPSCAPSSAPSGFNPFHTPAADVRGRTSFAAPDSGNVASINSGASSFVFGASAKIDHRTSKLRDGAFAFGSSNLDEEIGKLNLGSSSTGLRRSASLGMDEGAASQLPDVLRKLNLYSDGNETDRAERRPKAADNNAFVFGGGKDKCNVQTQVPDTSVSGSGGTNLFAGLPSEMEKLNLQRPENGTFVFGGSKNKSDEGTRNPVSGSGLYRNGDFISGLQNKMGKLNLQRPDVDANGTFVFGGSKHKSNEETQKPNPGRTNLYQNISRGTDGEFFSGLPNEMERMNLQTTEMSANGTFVFGGSKDVNGEDSRSFDPTAFLFRKIGSNLSSNSSFGSDEGSFTRLPDEMRKLNLQTSSFGSDEGSFTRLPDEMRKLNLQTGVKKNGFKMRKNKNCKFGGRVNMRNSSTNGDANKLPEDMKNLNIRKEAVATGKKDGDGFSVDVSVSGINSKLGSVTSQTATVGFTSLDKGKAPDHPDDAKKSDAQRSRHGFDTINTRDSDFRDKVDPGPSFVFGNSNSASDLFGATTRNLNPVDRSERIARTTEQVFAMDGSRTSEPSSFKFTFQNGKQDDTLNMGTIPQSQTNENVNPTPVATPLAYPSSSVQPVGSAFTSRNTHEGFETSQMEFKIQKEDPFWFSEENSCNSLRQSMAFSSKEEAKGAKTRKRRGKSSQRASIVKPFVSKENISPENSEHESLGGYSPMDYSPYQETLVADQGSTETSVASNEYVHTRYHCPLTDSHIPSSKDGREETIPVSMDGREESIITAAQRMTINDGDLKYEEPNEAGPEVCAERIFFSQCSSVEEQTSGLENLSVPTENDSVRRYNDNLSASFEAETGGTFTSNDKKEAGEGRSFFTFASSLEDHKKSNLTFVASPEQGSLLASKHRHRRKSRSKTGQDSYISTSKTKVPLQSPSPNWFSVARTSVDSDPQKGTSDSLFSLKTKNEINTEKNRKPDASQEPTTKVTASIAAKDACEKWRLRGNQAYANGHLSKAEDYYTRGVNSVSSDQMSGTCIQALMLCHSNRAATRMSLGRMREAIIDCKVALAFDPNFQRAQVRAANCHLALGEIKDSLEHFKNCLQLENKVNCDEKILSEASEGLKKAQQVGDWMNQSMELLLKRSRDDATKALQSISAALSISPYSESLLEMKAEALLMVHNYEEVIQISENSLDMAEKNSVIIGDEEQSKDIDNSENWQVPPERLWRWRLISMSYFYLGKFEEALELLQKHEKVKPIAARFWNKSQKPSRSLSVTICELLRLKVAGNEAFQAGKHLEAVEHYTSALTCNTESRPFTAICFCNRAAAYQALGQITNAIADCSLAIALDSNYQKAISRRATLHESIRDYGQAVNDLNRLISLLEKQSEDNDIISGETTRATRNCNDLKRARTRLSLMQDQARKGTPLDMYMILGVEPTSSAADVKKAYRKAALRHHPDKAGHYLTRSGSANDGLWKEVAVEVHGDADRLFKMIGEAYAVLSDSNKRLQYDEDEEMRNNLKKGYADTPTSRADAYGNQYDRGYHTRQWRPYESSHQRWTESSYYNR